MPTFKSFTIVFFLFLPVLLFAKPFPLSFNHHVPKPKVGKPGMVKLQFDKPIDIAYSQIYTILKTQKVMYSIIADFNDNIALPRDITVVFEECQEENAEYNRETGNISICYELIKNYVEASDLEISEAEKIQQATTFSMLHELGHALVHQLGIPITGKEENAVDEFAMMMLLASEDSKAADLAIEGALQFYYDSLDEDSVDFSDEHAPSKERYFDLLTLFVGAHTLQAVSEFIGNEDHQISESRAQDANRVYEQKRKTWDMLLSSFYK